MNTLSPTFTICIFFRYQITLVRPAPGSWGLRLQGGVDVQKALAIINVADGSPSEMSGLKVGWLHSLNPCLE